jgi:predicted enzyme related to lactoylglutathione lyase
MADRYKQHGAFSWNELMTTDPDAAKEFYGKLFNWEFQDMPMEGMIYSVTKAGGEEMGGIMSIPPEMQGTAPNWGMYVTVDNADETALLAEKLGGKIICASRDIPDVGRFAVIQDPQGAMICVITYSMKA